RSSARTLTAEGSAAASNRVLPRVVANVLESDRLAVDAAWGRRDPAREVAGLEYGVGHEAPDVCAVAVGGEPLVAAPGELLLGDLVAGGIEAVPGEPPLLAAQAPL